MRWATAWAAHLLTPAGRDEALVRADRSTVVFTRDSAGRVTGVVRSWESFKAEFEKVEDSSH